MNDNDEQETQGIDEDMPLAAFHLFASIVASYAGDLCGFDTLAIQTGSTGLCIASFSFPAQMFRARQQRFNDPPLLVTEAQTCKLFLSS